MVEHPIRSSHAGFDQQGVRVRCGGCLCGAVRFSVHGEPVVVGTCHCADCRKATGAAFVSYADWPRAAFSSTGEARAFNGRSFCPTGGSRVCWLQPFFRAVSPLPTLRFAGYPGFVTAELAVHRGNPGSNDAGLPNAGRQIETAYVICLE